VNVVIPMAGRGSRFATAAPTTPKPLVQVAGKPMVAWALRTLEGLDVDRLVFVVLAEHAAAFDLHRMLPGLAGRPVEIVELPGVTEGQLCTVLAAREHIDRDEPVLIAASDTYVDADLPRALSAMRPDCRGLISVADMSGEQWSFAKLGSDGGVVEVAEKVRISDHASTGLYWFASGRELCEIGDGMVARNERTRGEFYVIPVYQHLIRAGARVEVAPARRMWDMGTPVAAAAFEAMLRDQGLS
jgi:dTDP-glucose pyrophosphorylase